MGLRDSFFQELNEEKGTSRKIIFLGNLNGRTGRKNKKVVVGQEVDNYKDKSLIHLCKWNQLPILNGQEYYIWHVYFTKCSE